MSELRIRWVGLFIFAALAGCGGERTSAPAGSSDADAAAAEGGANRIPQWPDLDGGCRPAGSSCDTAEDMLTCCSRRCVADKDGGGLVCK